MCLDNVDICESRERLKHLIFRNGGSSNHAQFMKIVNVEPISCSGFTKISTNNVSVLLREMAESQKL